MDLAARVAAAMWAEDTASAGLGMRLVAVGEGTARLEMSVRDDMVNGHGIAHGGFVFSLADSAFAFACNSYNELTVASGFSADFVAPALLGDVLTARCSEVAKAGRTVVYDAEVAYQRGERVAVFRGRSYTVKGKPAVGE